MRITKNFQEKDYEGTTKDVWAMKTTLMAHERHRGAFKEKKDDSTFTFRKQYIDMM